MEIIKKYITKVLKIKKDFGRIIFLLFVVIFSISVFYFYSNLKNKNSLEIIFFDIGQGDSSLIKMPNGEKILIDAGPSNNVVEKLQNYFSIFDKKIDYVLLTHPDSDHISGFYFVAQNFNIENILENGDKNKETDIYKNIESLFKKQNLSDKEIFVNCGDEMNYKNLNQPKIFFLHPSQNNLVMNDTNENSVIALLVYGKYSFLFTGDMDNVVEKNLFNEIDKCFSVSDINFIKESLKNLTVLKVSHHGSKTASSEDFLKIIKPEYSVISVGKNNRYGHPSKETISTLEKYSKNIFDTSLNGSVVFSTDGINIEFHKDK